MVSPLSAPQTRAEQTVEVHAPYGRSGVPSTRQEQRENSGVNKSAAGKQQCAVEEASSVPFRDRCEGPAYTTRSVVGNCANIKIQNRIREALPHSIR